MTVAVEHDVASFLRKRFASDTAPVSLASDEFVDQKRILGERHCRTHQALRHEIRHFIPEPQNRRRLDAHKRDFRSNDILEQFDIADG